MFRWSIGLAGALALAGPMSVMAKPIAFADGYTVMAEYGAGTMKEAQLFYAPRYDFSVGGGHVELDSDQTAKSRRINYARLNYLVHRWNLDDAQANLFAWGGLGSATGLAGAVMPGLVSRISNRRSVAPETVCSEPSTSEMVVKALVAISA